MKSTILHSLFFCAFAITATAQQRIVLTEQFTNSGCPPCASSTPTVLQYVTNNPATNVAIAYHTSFPYNDSMYFENPAESNARVSYYNVFAVPFTVVDGNQYNGSSASFIPGMNAAYTSRAAVASPYTITTSGTQITGNTLQGTFMFTSLQNSNAADSLVAHIVVIEQSVQKNAYLASPGANSETVYHYVMRKMLPGSSGTVLQNRQLNGTDTIPFTWNLQHIKSIAEVRVVAFVQNVTTMEVYQAAMSDPNDITGIAANTNNTEFNLYPVPAHDVVIAATAQPFTGSVTITDLVGRMAPVTPLAVENANTVSIPLNGLTSGVYLVNFRNENGTVVRKIIVE
jgi:thiol-disulfide isomerase/thioredoxin